ncbi:1,2-phenylacetyl-CoA epoxidase subunit PaaE [Mobilicoccus massiliensis]|uniref:1,2-phenylacetyl-CoA epoxidase subunit PaaE n=1 Tax=Mobilicoccus massiliensis TaxID=1522310 RepID=UPI00058F2080|nr:1,2-phenylacetyl-CoA epoxidase subunit PaaE [Mobilicoccus massiliensis]
MPLTSPRRRARFHPLTVSAVRPLTADAVEVTLAVPEELADDYGYVSGQYVALRKELDGKEIRRSYSICAPPTRGELKIGIKRDLGGVFSNWANDHLHPGDTIDVMSPTGAFVSRHSMTSLNDPQAIAEESRGLSRYVAFAAGSGITPIISIVRSLLEANPEAYVNLVYANRAAMDVMFVEDLADLKDRFPARLAVHHVLSREQRLSPTHTGRIDADKLRSMFGTMIRPEVVDEWFLCGPYELVQLIRDELAAAGVSEDRIRYELFTTGDPKATPEGNAGRAVVADPTGENVDVTFRLDGLEGRVESPKSADESILNAALRVRGDVPFACAGGVCGTCRAKLVEGEVEMTENYALEPEEIEAGYVLTCQSHPTTDAVRVDFDA